MGAEGASKRPTDPARIMKGTEDGGERRSTFNVALQGKKSSNGWWEVTTTGSGQILEGGG